ncbi:MAG: UDP-N-acetylmuramoyl-L-alanine--D-glutamate ligase [Parachlamydiaceae bacterium]|nr:UDP-N-acetylmuramoyl-L-alanine--D-glutamate ligase [Parachlamydiaceae bacterium]
MINPVSHFHGKSLLVLGMGLSGRSAASFLLSQGARVVAYDKDIESLKMNPSIQTLKNQGLEFFDPKSKDSLKEFSVIVSSPGIPLSSPIYQEALLSGVEIIGEIELAFRHISTPCIGVTGTNGKTTVTLLIEHVLNKIGIEAKAVGNVGVPLTSMIGSQAEVLVVELSSYQLETMHSKILDAAVLLNITPDHLERYGNMEEYAEAKARIFECVKPLGNLLISEKCHHEWKGLFQKNKLFVFDRDKTVLNNFKDKSPHDIENLLAAYHICLQWGVNEEQFMRAQESFVKPPHRIEFVRNVRGVNFIDDSKGTNIDAVIKAVESINGPIILIAGGVDKGFSYSSWLKPFEGKVRLICVIGEASNKMYDELSSSFPVERFLGLETAVHFSMKNASIGNTVLLSPGCSSYDMFTDYTHRGREFQRIVNIL